jgi:pimeloyl-ACP methyl ester carboxylesterase
MSPEARTYQHLRRLRLHREPETPRRHAATGQIGEHAGAFDEPDVPASACSPTVVIHDSEDPMVRPRNGRSVARAIGGARYVVVDGTGHDLSKPVSRAVVEALTENMAFVTM